MTKPAMIHLISEMPDPAAYGANDLTSLAEVNANIVYAEVSCLIRVRIFRTYCKEDIKNIIPQPKATPSFPFRTPWFCQKNPAKSI